jgi:hypothetical protein
MPPFPVAAILGRNFRPAFTFTFVVMLRLRVRSFLLLVFCAGALSRLAIAQTSTLSGVVFDAATGDRLPAATVRVVGTDRGTIANADGSYRLSLANGPWRIAASFVGYRPDTVGVMLDGPTVVNIRLEPSPIRLAEVVVSGEDPAVAIMRRVIEEKRRRNVTLETYHFEAFTRQILRSDTSIASIMESYSSGYWRSGDTLREVIRQKRQTENLSMSQNFAQVGGITNFYEDEIPFGGYRFVGPTSPDAFDYYDFRLDRSFKQDGNTIFVIQLRPNTRLTPLLDGEVQVVDERFVLAGVDVRPNEAFIIPFISDFEVRSRQQFAPIQERYWLPVDIRTSVRVSVSLAAFKLPTISFEQTSTIYDYQINVPVPDSLFRQRRVQVDSAANRFDSIFWRQREVLPLTTEQAEAYRTIDSTKTLDKVFRPTGPLADADSSSLLGKVFSALAYADLRFNRVLGGFIGGRYSTDTIGGRWMVKAGAGYGFAEHRWSASAGISALVERSNRLTLGVDLYRDVVPVSNEGKHVELSNIVTALFDKNDYFDYLSVRGGRVWATMRPLRKLSLRADATVEDHRPSTKNTDFSLFYRSRAFRPQPAADAGRVHSITASLRWGDEALPINIIHADEMRIALEAADPSILGGDMRFMRWSLQGSYRISTLSNRGPFGPYLAAYLTAGLATGRVPVQRLFSLETQSSSYAPLGALRGASVKEFAGDRYVVLSLEHNFRSNFFLWLGIPYFYKNAYETIVTAVVASSAFATRTATLGAATRGIYTEAGFAVGRIFQLLRLDLTYRFTAPRGLHLTLGVSQLL